MKPGLDVLPMDLWADVFVFPIPWIKRKKLAQIVHEFKERGFVEKLQTFLHDPKCGKHTLNYLDISFKRTLGLTKQKTVRQASLAVTLHGLRYSYKDYEFPVTDMPENIKKFKELSIGFLDDQVLDFLDKIKSLFTNVHLNIRPLTSSPDMRILFAHLLPMLVSIRKIACNHTGFEVLKEHFFGTLALAKELDLCGAKPAFIPVYLNWLNAPCAHGPRLLKTLAGLKTINAIVDAVHEQFMAAPIPSTFAIIYELNSADRNKRAKELAVQNAATNEQLIVRYANFYHINYVEVLRHPIGADANMRERVKEWAYYECKNNNKYDHQAEQVISIARQSLVIGQITKKAKAIDQDGTENQSAEQEEAGP